MTVQPREHESPIAGLPFRLYSSTCDDVGGSAVREDVMIGNFRRLARGIARARSGFVVMAMLGSLLAVAAPTTAATADGPADATDLQASLQELGGASAAVSGDEAKDAHAEFLRRLGAVESAVRGCADFLARYGSNNRVVKILKELREKPARSLFTSPEIVADLERAVGKPIELSQIDIELCVQARDRRIGAKSAGTEPATFAAIDASLRKCLSSLNAIGPNAAGTVVLQRLGRHIDSDRFTSATKLAALELAVGRAVHLKPGDLVTCVDAYDLHAKFEQIVVADNPPPCGPNEDFCAGTGGLNPICCSEPGEVCQQTCGDGTCSAACVPQWCFPATARVRTEFGTTKAMRDVRLGDRLQVARPDGTLGYEDVYLNTHKDGTSSAPYVMLMLASGRALTLSPRHFIPVADDFEGAWDGRVERGADEVRPGDLVWSQGEGGRIVPDRVVRAETKVAVGAYNPLTLGGTIVVDGVIASAHSDWFLDGLVSADAQAKLYQAILAPVRVAYGVLGPGWMTTLTEDAGIVDMVRTSTGAGTGPGWLMLGLALTAGTVGLVMRRHTRAS